MYERRLCAPNLRYRFGKVLNPSRFADCRVVTTLAGSLPDACRAIAGSSPDDSRLVAVVSG
jgi:hypothetical protein